MNGQTGPRIYDGRSECGRQTEEAQFGSLRAPNAWAATAAGVRPLPEGRRTVSRRPLPKPSLFRSPVLIYLRGGRLGHAIDPSESEPSGCAESSSISSLIAEPSLGSTGLLALLSAFLTARPSD